MHLVGLMIICPNNNLIIRKCIRFTIRNNIGKYFLKNQDKSVIIFTAYNKIVNFTLHSNKTTE